MQKLEKGQIVQTKKKHPCGSDKWEVIRPGTDVKAKCLGCNHIIIIERPKFLKSIKNFNVTV